MRDNLYTGLLSIGDHEHADWFSNTLDKDMMQHVIMSYAGSILGVINTVSSVSIGELAFVMCRDPYQFERLGYWNFPDTDTFGDTMEMIRAVCRPYEALAWLFVQITECSDGYNTPLAIQFLAASARENAVTFDEYIRSESIGVTDPRMIRKLREYEIDPSLAVDFASGVS
jgi:hypothetical protein